MSDLPAVPDYYGQFMAPLQKQQLLGIEQQNANSQQAQVAMQAMQQAAKMRQAQAFQADAQSVISNPTPEGYRNLLLKHPDQYEGIKASWGEYSDAQRETDVNAAGQVYASLSNGRSDLALQLLRDRKSAEAAAGKDTKMTDSMIDLVSSGDPTKLKQAQGIAGFVLASSAGPDKIGPMLESLNKGHDSYTLAPGDIRYDENGGIVAQSPYIKGADGTLYERDGSGTAAAPGSSTAPAAGAGAGSAIDHVLGNEGGYLAKDGNGYPTNFGINAKANSAELNKLHIADLRLMTKDQAKQIYQDKYWPASGAENLPANLQAPYFDVYIRSPAFAKVALAKSGHDPVKFMQLAQDYFQKLAAQPKYARFAKAWANRDASNMAIASGQSPAPGGTGSAQSPATAGAPPGFHTLIPGKPEGLPSGYEADPTKPGAIRPIPGGPADNGSDDVLSKYGIAPEETGPSVLAKLPATLASQVKALAEGRRAPPSATALARAGPAAKYWNEVLQLTNQYDQSYDDSSFPARKAAITAFTGTGKGAMLVGSINRVANHMDLLWNESNKLAGPNTGFGPLDTALATTGQAFQRPDAKAYDTEVTFVAGELGKLAKAGVTTEGEVDRIIGNLSRTNSAKTRQAAIQAAVGIISGAVDPLKEQYNSAFTNNSTRPSIPWVTPKAQQIFSKIGGVDLSLTGSGADTNAPAGRGAAPIQVNSPADAAKLPSGTLFRTPDGRILRKR